MSGRNPHDALLRAAVLAELRPRAAWVREEVGVQAAAFADVAAIEGDRLVAYELKSDADTLRRLPTQAVVYGGVFDRITLVCGATHFARASEIVPPWWGMTCAWGASPGVRLQRVREPGDNPGVGWWSLVGLLWRAELRAVLVRRGIARGALGSKTKMGDRLKEHATLDELRAEVRTALATRDWDAREGAPS